MKVTWRWIAFAVLMFGLGRARAHETDQFTVPPGRKFADLGGFFNRWAYHAIEAGVNLTNAQVRHALEQKAAPGVLAELESPPHVTMAVRDQWPWSVTQIERFEAVLRSSGMRDRYPGRIVAYGDRFTGAYEFAFFPLDFRQFAHLLFFSSTIKVYGTYMGTDKLGHFTDEGISYYFAYHKAKDAGASEKDAIAQAVRIGTQGIMSERGLLGLAANADYANGDLAGNFAGFLFYRNLTETVAIKGRPCAPLLVRDGAYWRMAADVTPASAFFARFISDQLDEALNPGYFEPYMREGLRAGVRAQTKPLLEHYCDAQGRPRPREWFDRKFRELCTYWGTDYGHLGTYDELVTIGNSCFDFIRPPVPRLRPGSPARLASSVLLLAQGARPNARDHDGRTPLELAAGAGDAGTVGELLRNGASVSSADRFGRTPLELAAAAPSGAALGELLSAGAKVNARDAFGCTPLHDAARAGSIDAARRLLAGGADPRAADDYGATPLHLACRYGRMEIAKLLLDRGADVNAHSDAGVTPLQEAALSGDVRLVRVLLDHGALAGVRDRRGRTPADVAWAHGFTDAAALLRMAASSQVGGRR